MKKTQIVIALLCLTMLSILFIPGKAYAQSNTKTVRVGWFESAYNLMDSFGRRSGYSYEYQRKIADYTGWNYEYVEGSWPELMEMLKRGEIDLLSDVSYTEERANEMLFPAYPMGTEEYYVAISVDNKEYVQDNYAYFNGKKIGANKGSVQIDQYLLWAEHHNVKSELVELTCTESESLDMVRNGELDGYVIIDSYNTLDKVIPTVKLGASDYYFAVNKNRPDLLSDLDRALSRILDENRFYSQQLFDKYVRSKGSNLFLASEEREWLSSHGPI